MILRTAGLFILGSLFFGGASFAEAAAIPIQGYAWSDYLGAIHFNGANYGVFQDSGSGELSGYAWSPYFGAITFNESELSGCPSGSCQAKVTGSGAVTGWARSCAAFANKAACSGALDAGTGGWDGWIHLSGSNYGITSTNGCWSGYAWGSQNIGPIKFSGTAQDGSTYKVGDSSCGAAPTCTATTINNCSLPATSSGSSAGSCSTGYSGICDYACTAGAWSMNSNACTLTACANGANNPPTCTTFDPTASLTASPSTIDQGQSTTLTWSSTNATSCVNSAGNGTAGFTTGSDNPPSGSDQVGPLTDDPTNYSITCTGPGGQAIENESITVLQPSVIISADPTRVLVGASSQISWSANGVRSCIVSGPSSPPYLASGDADNSNNFSENSPSIQTITAQSVFTIVCKTSGDDITRTVTVNVPAVFEEF